MTDYVNTEGVRQIPTTANGQGVIKLEDGRTHILANFVLHTDFSEIIALCGTTSVRVGDIPDDNTVSCRYCRRAERLRERRKRRGRYG